MAMPSVPNTNAGSGTIPGEASAMPTIAVNTISKLTLGFVSSMKSRHAGRDSAVISGSLGAIAMASGWLVLGARLALHLNQSIHRHHVVVQMSHDDHRSEYNEAHNENAKGERENIVGLVRRARDVQEEHQVNPHLSNRENTQQNGDARRIDHIGRRSPKGGQCQNHRVP